MTMLKRRPIQREHSEQTALFRWAAMNQKKYPELWALYAVPNAARRSPRQGAWMKAEGLKAGVPDIILPVPRGTKAGKGTCTPAQLQWHSFLRELGNRVEVCRGWNATANVIEKYLQGIDW